MFLDDRRTFTESALPVMKAEDDHRPRINRDSFLSLCVLLRLCDFARDQAWRYKFLAKTQRAQRKFAQRFLLQSISWILCRLFEAECDDRVYFSRPSRRDITSQERNDCQ